MEGVRVALYGLALLTSVSCTVLLFRAYARQRLRLLMWSAFCFAGLSINNLLLFADFVLLPSMDLRFPRLIAALGGVLFMLYGFIWDAE
jgi:Family of unknown function (DUF5985)